MKRDLFVGRAPAGDLDRRASRAALAAFALALLGLVFAVSVAGPKVGLGRALLSHGTKLAVGTLILLLLTRFPARSLARFAFPAFLVTWGMVLAAALFSPAVNGARRWIFLAGRSFQPSELAKVALIVVTAKLAARAKSPADYYKAFWPAGLLSLTLFLQPDVGTAVVCLAVAGAVLFAAGLPWRHVAVLTLLGGVLMAGAFLSMPHVRKRVQGFLRPTPGSQVSLALVTTGKGGALGTGLGGGEMKLGHLPQCGNDFIFSVVGEELGFLGGALVLFLLGFFAYQGFQVAGGTRDPFLGLVAFGAVFSIFFQGLAHVAVNTAMAPAKGIDFPLLGSGGSSLCFALGSVGLLRSVARSQGGAGSPAGEGSGGLFDWKGGNVANVERYGVLALCFLIVVILGISLWGEGPEVSPALAASAESGISLRESDPGLFAGAPMRLRRAGGTPRAGRAASSRPLPPAGSEERRPSLPRAGSFYVVKKGDILGRIAQRHYGTVKAVPLILEANPELGDGSRLRVGQRILLPFRKKGGR